MAILEVVDDGGVRTIALNRPERLNALNLELLERLPVELGRAADDPTVRVVVLAGRGRAFCAGGDLELLLHGKAGLAQAIGWEESALLLREMPKPTIAAVNGMAIGAGFSLTLAADFRVASEVARFASGFAAVGLSGDFGGTWSATRLVGPELARRLYLLGETWDAATALQRGLVSTVAPESEFEAEVSSMARRLATGAPLALARMKANFRAVDTGSSFEEILHLEAQGMIDLVNSLDCREGLDALRERRAPDFHGQ